VSKVAIVIEQQTAYMKAYPNVILKGLPPHSIHLKKNCPMVHPIENVTKENNFILNKCPCYDSIVGILFFQVVGTLTMDGVLEPIFSHPINVV
jgi:hypothetical protein